MQLGAFYPFARNHNFKDLAPQVSHHHTLKSLFKVLFFCRSLTSGIRWPTSAGQLLVSGTPCFPTTTRCFTKPISHTMGSARLLRSPDLCSLSFLRTPPLIQLTGSLCLAVDFFSVLFCVWVSTVSMSVCSRHLEMSLCKCS